MSKPPKITADAQLCQIFLAKIRKTLRDELSSGWIVEPAEVSQGNKKVTMIIRKDNKVLNERAIKIRNSPRFYDYCPRCYTNSTNIDPILFLGTIKIEAHAEAYGSVAAGDVYVSWVGGSRADKITLFHSNADKWILKVVKSISRLAANLEDTIRIIESEQKS